MENLENNNFEQKSKPNLLLIGVVILLLLIIAIVTTAILRGRKVNKAPETVMEEKSNKTELNNVIPQNAKSPEEFLQKVKAKSTEIQKNYDTNLAQFAERRWENIFKNQNNLDSQYLIDNLNILTQDVQKDDAGNTLFKISYRVGAEGASPINEDFFYLVISDAKKSELGLSDLPSNNFLSEENIAKNINKEGFAKITKIQK